MSLLRGLLLTHRPLLHTLLKLLLGLVVFASLHILLAKDRFGILIWIPLMDGGTHIQNKVLLQSLGRGGVHVREALIDDRYWLEERLLLFGILFLS